MDEEGIPLEHNPKKVVSGKSCRRVPGRVSNSRERNTVVVSVNGTGELMPPFIIVKGQTQKSVMSYNTADGPEGARWTFQKNAWTEDIYWECNGLKIYFCKLVVNTAHSCFYWMGTTLMRC